MVDPNQYFVVYHYDDGTTESIGVHASSYTLAKNPPTYQVGSVTAKFQLFNAYGQTSTSRYGSTSFTITRLYDGWKTAKGVRFRAGSTIQFSSYAINQTVDLYPYVYRHQAQGKFNTGAYENKNITITGKANYDGGTDVSIKSSLSRQHKCTNWYDCNGTSISVSPGATKSITLPASYTYPTSLLIKGSIGTITAWTTYSSSKAISALPSLAARPSTSTYHHVTLEYEEQAGLRTEKLPVQTNHSFTFSHWATDAAGTTAADTSLKPTVNTTVYAVWDESSSVSTTLPTWTTTDFEVDPDSQELDTTFEIVDSRGDDYSTELYSYYSTYYPLKHVNWLLNGSSSCACGSIVTGGEGSTYTAVFTLDKNSNNYHYDYYPDTFSHPEPISYKGHEYLGLSLYEDGSTIYVPAGQDIPAREFRGDGGLITFFRVWKRTTPLGLVRIYNSTTGTTEKYKPIIYNSTTSQWESYLPKIYNGTDWNDIYS